MRFGDYRDVTGGDFDAVSSITRPDNIHVPRVKGGFVDRYIFPDGELTGAAGLITALQDAGPEMRHPENLREHYARTGAVVRGTRCGRRSASESRKFG